MTINMLSMPTPTRHADDNPWENSNLIQRHAVLTIRNLPRGLRSDVESAMVVCVPTPSDLNYRGEDPMLANWCTTWHRSRENRRAVECREVITGSERELGHLRDVLSHMAAEHRFDAAVSVLR